MSKYSAEFEKWSKGYNLDFIIAGLSVKDICWEAWVTGAINKAEPPKEPTAAEDLAEIKEQLHKFHANLEEIRNLVRFPQR